MKNDSIIISVEIGLGNKCFTAYTMDLTKKYIEFNLNDFEDYLEERRIRMARVDLVLKVQKILKAEKIKGKINNKSCVRWRIQKYEVPKEDLIIEGEAIEVKEKTNDQT